MGVSESILRCSRRRVVGSLAATVLLALPSVSSAARRPQNILFVCQFGSVKSAVTRELFRRRAAERGIRITAFSRGITPEAHLAPQLQTQLMAEAIDPGRDGLHQLEQHDLAGADIVVVFDRLPATWHAVDLRDWTDIGSFNDRYATERAGVMARIDALLDEIARRERAQAGK